MIHRCKICTESYLDNESLVEHQMATHTSEAIEALGATKESCDCTKTNDWKLKSSEVKIDILRKLGYPHADAHTLSCLEYSQFGDTLQKEVGKALTKTIPITQKVIAVESDENKTYINMYESYLQSRAVQIKRPFQDGTESKASEDFGEYETDDIYPSDPDGGNIDDDGLYSTNYLTPAHYSMSQQDMNRHMVEKMKEMANYSINNAYGGYNIDEIISKVRGYSSGTSIFDLPHSVMQTDDAFNAMQSAKDEVVNWLLAMKQEQEGTLPSPTWESKASEAYSDPECNVCGRVIFNSYEQNDDWQEMEDKITQHYLDNHMDDGGYSQLRNQLEQQKSKTKFDNFHHESKASEIQNYLGIELDNLNDLINKVKRADNYQLQQLAEYFGVEKNRDDIISEMQFSDDEYQLAEYRRILGGVKLGEAKANEYKWGERDEYKDYFDQAYSDFNDEKPITGVRQCDYCSAQFRDYDHKGMIDHVNSNHGENFNAVTGINPTFPSWDLSRESIANEEETMDCPVCKNPNAPKMDRVSGMCKNCLNRLGESKANEYGDPLVGSWDEGGWFFGIPNLTRDDYEGSVYWKGKRVEHYDHDYFGGDGFEQKMEADARALAEKCKDLESRGIEPSLNAILNESKASEEEDHGDHFEDTLDDHGASDIADVDNKKEFFDDLTHEARASENLGNMEISSVDWSEDYNKLKCNRCGFEINIITEEYAEHEAMFHDKTLHSSNKASENLLDPKETDSTTCVICGVSIEHHNNPQVPFGNREQTDHYFLGGDIEYGLDQYGESKASEVSDDERIRDWLGVMEKNNVSFLSPSMMADDLGIEWSKANDWIERWNGSLKALRQGYESKASESDGIPVDWQKGGEALSTHTDYHKLINDTLSGEMILPCSKCNKKFKGHESLDVHYNDTHVDSELKSLIGELNYQEQVEDKMDDKGIDEITDLSKDEKSDFFNSLDDIKQTDKEESSEYLIKEEFDLQDQDGKYEMLSKADLSVTDSTNYSTYSHDELPEEVKDSLKGDGDTFGESKSKTSETNYYHSLDADAEDIMDQWLETKYEGVTSDEISDSMWNELEKTEGGMRLDTDDVQSYIDDYWEQDREGGEETELQRARESLKPLDKIDERTNLTKAFESGSSIEEIYSKVGDTTQERGGESELNDIYNNVNVKLNLEKV